MGQRLPPKIEKRGGWVFLKYFKNLRDIIKRPKYIDGSIIKIFNNII